MKSLVVLFKISKLYGRKFDFSGIPKYISHGFSVSFMFPSINCEFIDFNNDEILVHSGLIEIFSASHTY